MSKLWDSLTREQLIDMWQQACADRDRNWGLYVDACADTDYWTELALTKRRIWLSKFDRPFGRGSDEYWRHTVWVGPVVVALWHMQPEHRKALAAVARPEEQA